VVETSLAIKGSSKFSSGIVLAQKNCFAAQLYRFLGCQVMSLGQSHQDTFATLLSNTGPLSVAITISIAPLQGVNETHPRLLYHAKFDLW